MGRKSKSGRRSGKKATESVSVTVSVTQSDSEQGKTTGKTKEQSSLITLRTEVENDISNSQPLERKIQEAAADTTMTSSIEHKSQGDFEQQTSVPSETDAIINEKEMAKEVFGLYKSISYNTMIPKGKPKSGRKWKTEQPVRFSDVKKDKPLRTSWERKMKEKAEKKSIKMYERQLKESREQEIQKKKEWKANKLKRKQENERKSEVVQVIHNTAKLKRMKKKQLRKIEKR